MSARDLIRQERLAHGETLVGVIKSVRRKFLADLTNPTWAADVDIGAGRLVKDAIIKANARGTRFWAQLGSTVLLKRNVQGKWDIVGPGDRTIGLQNINEYDVGVPTPTATTQAGFTAQVQPLEFYQGAVRLTGNPALTFAASTITRAAGSWLDDGFTDTMSIRVGASLLNDGVQTVSGTPTATVLTVSGTPFSAEGPSTGIAVAEDGQSRWANGSDPFPRVLIVDVSTGLEVT